ncbi:MAG: hypothetical protein WCG47_27035 [Dermatophilaceae bacterium]
MVQTSSRAKQRPHPGAVLQLACNEWDAAAKASPMRVQYNFGRAEEMDRAAVYRLIAALLFFDSPASGVFS